MSVIDSILLRSIPEAARFGLESGELAVFGSVIRSSKTGQIVYHLQETGLISDAASALLQSGLSGPLGMATQMAGDAALYRQGRQIQQTVDLIRTGQTAGMIMSGATLGVSVVGFAVIASKIDRVERELHDLRSRQDEIRSKVREILDDRINEDLVRLRTAAQQMEESWTLQRPDAQLDRVASEGHLLSNRFFERGRAMLLEAPGELTSASPFLEAFTLASNVRVAARLASDEVEAAENAANSATGQYEAMIDACNSTAAPILIGKTNPDFSELHNRFDNQFTARRDLARKFRMSGEAMEGARGIARLLIEKELSGREYLAEARAEASAPILLMRAS